MKVVILAGGLGTRISEESYLKPVRLASDPELGIRWPLPIVELSARDTRHAGRDGGFAGVSP